MSESDAGRHADDVAIVTGSTRGIGAGVAKRLAAEGAAVVVNGRSEAEGEAVVESIRDDGGEAVFIEADMRDPAAIAALIEEAAERYGRVDVLVNNAGVQTETTATEATIEDWEFVVETDFRSFWLCAKHAVEVMPEGGTIVNMSSNHAFLTMPGLFPYNAVKAGINGMTRALALELGPLGIRVNTINPGWIEIERTREELSADDRERVESMHPLGRIGTPDDVAATVSFLTSDEASFITGASLLVDGGRSAVMQDHSFLEYSDSR
ncbi:SDR family NAD(P)-dependent oxidoreductase [Haloarcula onubensis]|uniref:Glucose 1-dehydrogenase n=1 Tax=Haloarcula onubensis TaxID=2950539 RepID=A0ABU2FIU7_9EURY|nr:glucose 1-dehydrogenase [Halomicroarcula sp. S3CR25-11]MDS0280678.1 glucose 1-dehydrogenase [Halomicroarcula sp. S3CR25-11]